MGLTQRCRSRVAWRLSLIYDDMYDLAFVTMLAWYYTTVLTLAAAKLTLRGAVAYGCRTPPIHFTYKSHSLSLLLFFFNQWFGILKN